MAKVTDAVETLRRIRDDAAASDECGAESLDDTHAPQCVVGIVNVALAAITAARESSVGVLPPDIEAIIKELQALLRNTSALPWGGDGGPLSMKWKANRKFIIKARETIPALIAALRAARRPSAEVTDQDWARLLAEHIGGWCYDDCAHGKSVANATAYLVEAIAEIRHCDYPADVKAAVAHLASCDHAEWEVAQPPFLNHDAYRECGRCAKARATLIAVGLL